MFPKLWWVLCSGAVVPRRLCAPISLMREPSRLDIVGSGSNLQPMLFSPQRNKPSYSMIPLWHPWPKCLQSHPPTATTFSLPLTLLFLFLFFFFKTSLIFCGWNCCCYGSDNAYFSINTGMRHASRKCKSTNPTWATFGQTGSHIQTHTGALLCLACSASVSVYTACDSSG